VRDAERAGRAPLDAAPGSRAVSAVAALVDALEKRDDLAGPETLEKRA
jgi:hypothetical protein